MILAMCPFDGKYADLTAAESHREWFCQHAITIELLLSAFKGLRAGGIVSKEAVSSYQLCILVQEPI